MTAGSIFVPTIIPLRAPGLGRKNIINSSTKIEIRTETPDTVIHFTINGTKPDPFQRMGEKCTLQYRGPFTLPAGKQNVKAVAVSKDGMRESNVVSKVFDVQYIPPPPMEPPIDDDLGFQEEWAKERTKMELKRAQSKLMTSSQSAWTDVAKMKETQQMLADMSVIGSNHRKPGTGPRFLNSRRGNPSDIVSFDDLDVKKTQRCLPENSTQAMRLQRETDFLKCIHCFADRPTDPFARFCTSCGHHIPPIPQTRIAPPEPGQMGMCVYCKSMVPFNTPTCVVCEGPIPVQNQPMATILLSDRLICTLCGTANPSNLIMCVTCDTRLPTTAQQKAIYSGLSAPAVTNPEKKYLTCTKCKRVNNGDARFCDWCGAKPGPPSSALQCSKCHASNHPYSTFCGSCGIQIQAPSRIEYRPIGNTSMDSKWIPVTIGVSPSSTITPTSTVAVQTVGLFYPSQRGLDKKKEADAEKIAFEKQMRDRRPLLTSISPGRGYWRKQVDHICQHLKAKAQNDAEFRALIGEPKMGNLITSSIQEDGYELSLNLTFALRGNKDPFIGKQLGVSHHGYLSMHTENDSVGSYRSDSEVSEDRMTPVSNRKKSAKRAKAKKKYESKLSPINVKLLRELGSSGEGSPSNVQQYIDEGADVLSVNKNGLPVLHVAVIQKRVESIPVIIDAGADINRKGPSSIKGNTALHEAANLGPSGLKVIDTLLSCGADQNRKNDRGETPYDLAAKAGFDSIVKKFASALGQSQLDRMMKPRK